jgi:hypothetical protein
LILFDIIANMSAEQQVVPGPGYLLNVRGYAGLGETYIDVLPNGIIQLESVSLSQPYQDARSLREARRSYCVVVEIGTGEAPQILLERSIFAGNDDFKYPGANRPRIQDVLLVLGPGGKSVGLYPESAGIRKLVEDALTKVFTSQE